MPPKPCARMTQGCGPSPSLVFIAALIVVALGAAISANNLLFLIVAAMFATFSISGLVSRLVLAGLELELMLPALCSFPEPASILFHAQDEGRDQERQWPRHGLV